MSKRRWMVGVFIALGLAASACGAVSPATTPTPSVSGAVDVLYAGSLVNAMENQIGPAFDRATGASFQGFSGGSTALANEIKGRVQVGDVFISAATDADTSLEGAANGGWVSWYTTFGTSPLVIAYNSYSRFAAVFRSKPWYRVLTLPGILVGRTDPATDPKGKLTVSALETAQSTYNVSGFTAAVEAKALVFPEETLVGRLQSGQLDAGFFYTLEATPLHLPTVSLSGIGAAATFTITVLNHAPHPTAAAAFVAWLLGSAGRSILRGDGMTLDTATLSGPATAVPSSLTSVAGG